MLSGVAALAPQVQRRAGLVCLRAKGAEAATARKVSHSHGREGRAAKAEAAQSTERSSNRASSSDSRGIRSRELLSASAAPIAQTERRAAGRSSTRRSLVQTLRERERETGRAAARSRRSESAPLERWSSAHSHVDAAHCQLHTPPTVETPPCTMLCVAVNTTARHISAIDTSVLQQPPLH